MLKHKRYTRRQLQWLQQRWIGFEEKIEKLPNILRTDTNWDNSKEYKLLIQSLEHLPNDLDGVQRDLRGIPLKGCNLSGSNLNDTDLSGADLTGTILIGAKMWGANLFETDISEANLKNANLSGSGLEGTNISGAKLKNADLEGVIYTTNTIINGLINSWIPLIMSRIPYVKRKIRKISSITNFEFIDASSLDSSQNPLLRRYIEDYQYVQAFRKKSWFHKKIMYPVWKLSSDCGRSFLAWSICSIAIALIFGLIYAPFTAPIWLPEVFQNIFSWANPEIYVDSHTYNHSLWTPMYFSIVIFTTLGFGDVQPSNGAGLFWVSFEVILGYIMLGGMVSIFASKLSRRA